MICAENETTKKRDNGDGKVGSNNINTINRYETMKKKMEKESATKVGTKGKKRGWEKQYTYETPCTFTSHVL